MPLERIDKILSSQNIATRSETKSLIRKGLVSVNGVIVKKADEKFDPQAVTIAVNGVEISYRKHIYLMMNKPSGVLSASRDIHAKTVLDLLPDEYKRRGLFPAGRLDKDTEGLLIITDDGDFAHKMLSPKNHVYKQYYAETDRTLCVEDVKAFLSGITQGVDSFKPAGLKLLGNNKALVEICEGKFHQVKRMFEAVGATVVKLKRIKIGEVALDENLPFGSVRELTNDEKVNIMSRKAMILTQK